MNLLCEFIRPEARATRRDDGEALALRLARALDSGGLEQRARLRSLGDFSLFMSGFFSDHFRRGLVDVDYYVSMGEYAYASLGRRDVDDAFTDVFRELAGKFVGFMDVLSDVSERTAVATNSDLLRTYEKWLRTGSDWIAKKLRARGVITPRSGGGGGELQ